MLFDVYIFKSSDGKLLLQRIY